MKKFDASLYIVKNRYQRGGRAFALALAGALALTASIARAGDTTQPAVATTTRPDATMSPLPLTLLSLHVKDAPVLEVIHDIEWQTGLDLTTQQPYISNMLANKTISFDSDNIAFWDAMDAIRAATNLSAMPMPQSKQIGRYYMLTPMMQYNTDPKYIFTTPDKLFTVKPTQASMMRQQRYTDGGHLSQVTVMLDAQRDPAIAMAHLDVTLENQQALGEDGNDLLKKADARPEVERAANNNAKLAGQRAVLLRGRILGGVQFNNSPNGSMTLQLKDDSAKQVTVEGDFQVGSDSPVHPMLFLDPKPGTKKTFDGITVTIVSISDNKLDPVFRFKVESAAGAVAWNPTEDLASTYMGINAKSQILNCHEVVAVVDHENEYQLTFKNAPVPRAMQQMQRMQNLPNQPGIAPNQGAARPANMPTHLLLEIVIPAKPIHFTDHFRIENLPLP